MCQRSLYEAPLQMIVHSMCELIKQVKENTNQCTNFLSAHDIQLNAAFLGAEQTATQLQSQLEQIIRDLDLVTGKGQPRQTVITYFD